MLLAHFIELDFNRRITMMWKNSPQSESAAALTYEVHVCVSAVRVRFTLSLGVTAGDDGVKEL